MASETPVTDQVSDVMHVEDKEFANMKKVEEDTAPPSEVFGEMEEKEGQKATESTDPDIATTVANGKTPETNGEKPSNDEHEKEEEHDKKPQSEILNENGVNEEISSTATSGESTVEVKNESETGLTSISETTTEVEEKPLEKLELSAIPEPEREVLIEPEEEKVKEPEVEKPLEKSEPFSIQEEVIKEPEAEESSIQEPEEKSESSLNQEPEQAVKEVEVTDSAEEKPIEKSELSLIHEPEKGAVQELEVRESQERSEPSSTQEQLQEQIKEPEVMESVTEKLLKTSEPSSAQEPEQGELKEPEGVNSSVEKPQETSETASFQPPEQQVKEPEVVEPTLEKPVDMIEPSSIQEPEVGAPKSLETPEASKTTPDEPILASVAEGNLDSLNDQVPKLTNLDGAENIAEGMIISQSTDTDRSEKSEIENGDVFPPEKDLKDSIPTASELLLETKPNSQKDTSVEGTEMVPESLDSECPNKAISKDATVSKMKDVTLCLKSDKNQEDTDEKESGVAVLEEFEKEKKVKSAIDDLSVATATIETIDTKSIVEARDNHVAVEDNVEEETGFSFPTEENRNNERKGDGSEKLIETSRDVDVDEKANTVEASLKVAPRELKSAESEKKSEEEKKVVAEKTNVQEAPEPLQDAEDSKAEAVITNLDIPAKATRRSSGIISKVKHSIVKAKKAILGKSPSSKTISSEAKNEIKVK